MSNILAGSRWECTLAIKLALDSTLQKYADDEGDRLGDVYGELANSNGSGVLLRIPALMPVEVALDAEIINDPDHMPKVVVGAGGPTRYIDANATVGRSAFAETAVEISCYASTRANYQGSRYRLTSEECSYVATGLAQAVIVCLRSGGIGSTWAQGAGIVIPQIDAMVINGHSSTDTDVTAVKASLRVVVSHEVRY
jgi:hypothetical protein